MCRVSTTPPANMGTRSSSPSSNALRAAGTDSTRRYGASGIPAGSHGARTGFHPFVPQRSSAFLDSFHFEWWGGGMAEVEQQLREASLRVTAPRLAVLAEVHAQPHADVDSIAASVRTRLGSVSTQAVYDVLRVL